MDLDLYLKRIFYNGPINNASDTLQRLCECHMNNVPFDTVDMFGGKRKQLDLEKMFQDIVVNRRGGFCYENNGLFYWLLEKFGFNVQMLQSQAHSHGKFNPKFDHMTAVVTSGDGKKWLTDVGFGGNCFKLPLMFKEDIEQPQENGLYRLVKSDEDVYLVQRHSKKITELDGTTRNRKAEKWVTFYKFDCVPRQLSDFEAMCDYQQDDDSAFLKHNTLCSIYKSGRSFTLWGWCVRQKRFIDPTTEEIVKVETAQTQQELKKLLSENFGINVDFHVKVKQKDNLNVVN